MIDLSTDIAAALRARDPRTALAPRRWRAPPRRRQRGMFPMPGAVGLGRPSTDPVPPVGSILSMNFDGPNGSTTFIDDSPYARTFTASGSAVISTAEFVDGGSSLSIPDTSTSYITAAVGAEMSWSGSFTWQTDAFFLTNTNQWMFSGSGNSAFLAVEGNLTGGAGHVRIGRANIAYDLTSSNLLSLNTWYRIRAQRIGTALKLYVNDVEVASQTNSITYTIATPIRVGQYDGTFRMIGYLDNLRMD